MPTDRESSEIKKAMAYDLFNILDATSGKEHYTAEEIKALIRAYIAGTDKD